MPVVFTCPACGKTWSAEDRFAGTQTVCGNPACRRPVTIPRAAPPSQVKPVPPPSPAGYPPPAKPRPVAQPVETPSGGSGGKVAVVLLLLVLVLGGAVAAAVVALRFDGDSTPPTPITEKDKDGKDKDRPPPSTRPGLPPASGQWQGHIAPIIALGPNASRDGLWSVSGGLEDDRGTRRPFRDSTLRAWSAAGRELKRHDDFERGYTTAAISPDGRFAALVVAAGGVSGEIALVDLASGTSRAVAESKSPVGAVCFSADGRSLFAGGEDGRVLLIDTATTNVRRVFSSPSAVTALAASPDGQWLLGGMAKAVRLWDANTGDRRADIATLDTPVVALAFAPDSKSAVFSGRADHDLTHYDLAANKERGRFSGHVKGVTALAFDPSGARLIAGAEDGQVRVWDADTRRQAAAFTSQSRAIRAIAVLPDGRQAVAAGDQATMRVLNLPAVVADAAKDLRGDDVTKRKAAAAVLGKDPERALAARADLLAALGRKGCPVRGDVVAILEKQGVVPPEFVEALAEVVADGDFPRGRRWALNQLRELGAKARPAAKAVVALLGDADPDVRREALAAAAGMASVLGPTALKPILRALSDADRETRIMAEAVFEKMPAPGVEQLREVKTLLTAKQASVRLFGVRAIAAMGGDAAEAAEDIAKAAGDPAEEVRIVALACLAKIAPKSPKTLEVARRGLDDANPDILRESARLLAAAGDVKGLLAAAGNADADVARLAAESLEKAAVTKDHVPALLDLFASRREAARTAALLALGRLGADAADAVEPLAKKLPTAETNEQKRLLLTLAKLGPDAAKASKAAADLLGDRNRDVRLYAAALVIATKAAESAKAAAVLMPELLPAKPDDLTSETHAKDRERIRELLVSMGKDAVGPVYEMLENGWARNNFDMRDTAKCLGRLELYRVVSALGSTADTPEMLKMLARRRGNEPDPTVKRAADDAYRAIQKKKE